MNPKSPQEPNRPASAPPAESDVSDSNAAYQALVEKSPAGILILDWRRRILMANDTAAALLGAPVNQLAGKDILSFLHPDCWEIGADFFRPQPKGGSPSTVRELALLQQHGESVSVDATAVGILWSGAAAVFVTLLDVTRRKQIENTLRREREQLFSIFDSIDQVIYVADPVSYEILFVNRSLREHIGKDPTGGICYREFQGLDKPCDFCTNRIILGQRETPYTWEHHNALTGCDYLVTDKSIVWPDGRDVRFEVAMDITERKKTEAVLRESESRYRELVENLNEVVYTISDTGTFTFVGPAVQPMLGYTPEELIGRSITEFIMPEDLPKSGQALAQVIAGQRRSSEYRVVAKDGSLRWLRTSSRPHSQSDGKVGMWGVFSDVTERKALELQLQESEKAFRAIAETAGEGILVMDENRRALYVNLKAMSMVGHSEEELLGRDMLAMVASEQQDEAAQRFRDLMGNVRRPERDVLLVLRSGARSLTVEIISTRTKWFGQEALLLMFHDVSHRLRMEEEALHHQENLERKLAERTEYIRHIEHRQSEFEKLAAVSGLAARIAHEINNPLGGVKNAFLLIKDEISPDAPHAKYVPMVEKEIDRMSRIVRELYDLCRPGSAPTGRFCVADTLREVISLLEAESLSCNVRLETDVKPPDGMFFGNEDALRQILFNLIKNAIEASSAGGMVSITGGIETDGLHLSFADHGGGIPDDVRARIFEPFFSTKLSRERMGLGLGLPVCKNLIEQLGGSLTFESEAGQGTTFHLWLPSLDPGEIEAID